MRPLKHTEPGSIAVKRLEHFTIEMTQVRLCSIMKREDTRAGRKKGVSFDGTCHVHHAQLLIAWESP